MPTMKRAFTLRLSDEVFARLDAVSKKEHRTKTNLIEYSIIQFLDKYEQDNKTMYVNWDKNN